MRRNLISFFLCLIFLITGLFAGVFFGPQLRLSAPFSSISSIASKVPGLKAISQTDENSAFEMYDYPTIKWKPKPLNEKPGAIAQLWTRYEAADAANSPGKMNYRLTIFKAPDKSQVEVQLLDDMGFKLSQFNASDFHQIPGSSDIMEARESHQLSEGEYRKVRDYSIK